MKQLLFIFSIFLLGCTSVGTFDNGLRVTKAKINGNAETEYKVKYKDGEIVEETYKIKRKPIISLNTPDIKIDNIGK